VENGTLRYPDLPLPARDIFVDLSLTNPGGALDHTVVDIRRFRVVMGSDPIEGSFVMRQPVSDPDIDLRLAGRLDLADVGRTFKLEGVDELAGIVVADATMRARMSDLDGRRYDRVRAEGGFTVADLLLRTMDLPHPMRIEEAQLRLTPSHAELASFRGAVGSTDLELTGQLDNLLGFALRDEELRGQARLTSRFVDLDEWRSDDDLEAVMVPGNIDFALDATIGRVKFGALDMHNARGGLRVKDRRATLEDFRMDMLGGAMAVSGFYDTVDPVRPLFDIDLRMVELDVPAAFAGLGTVRAFAPVARYAQGSVSAEVKLAGALGQDMAPVLDMLSGQGAFRTAGLVLNDFPALDRLADMLHVPAPRPGAGGRGIQLRDPGRTHARAAIQPPDRRPHHERVGVQRDRPVAAVFPRHRPPPRRPGHRGEPGRDRPHLAGRARGPGVAGIRYHPARGAADRHHHQPDRRGELPGRYTVRRRRRPAGAARRGRPAIRGSRGASGCSGRGSPAPGTGRVGPAPCRGGPASRHNPGRGTLTSRDRAP